MKLAIVANTIEYLNSYFGIFSEKQLHANYDREKNRCRNKGPTNYVESTLWTRIRYAQNTQRLCIHVINLNIIWGFDPSEFRKSLETSR